MWCGYTTSTVIEPFFLEEIRYSGFETVSMTSERHADMLQNRILPSLADKYLLKGTTFMQDDAPPHISRQVKDLLHRSFGDNPVLSHHFGLWNAWLPMHSDLNPFHYWL